MTEAPRSAEELCARHGVAPQRPDPGSRLGWSRTAVPGAEPLNGLRHPPVGDTCGWYVWGGEELSGEPDFFEPLHVEHVAERLPEVLPFLALPPGWRFLLAPGFVDVWFDPELLEVDA